MPTIERMLGYWQPLRIRLAIAAPSIAVSITPGAIASRAAAMASSASLAAWRTTAISRGDFIRRSSSTRREPSLTVAPPWRSRSAKASITVACGE